MKAEQLRRWVNVCAVLVVIGCGLWIVRPVNNTGRPAEPIVGGEEIVLVFVASSTCAGINDPRLKDGLGAVRKYFREHTKEQGQNLVSVGVAIDMDISVGGELLREFGPFDEVHVGRWYLNSAAQRFFSTYPGAEAVPQLIVLERTVKVTGGVMRIIDERVVLRKIGAEPIWDWARAAATIG